MSFAKCSPSFVIRLYARGRTTPRASASKGTLPRAGPRPFAGGGRRRSPTAVIQPRDWERTEGREYDGSVEADATVVARVADGDTEALRLLYDRYGRIVYGMTYRLTRDSQLAEEATQDTFVAVWRRADSFDPGRAKLTTWLFVIARNRAIELIRARTRAPEPHESVEPTGQEADPADLAALADDAERIARALAELPENQLEVIQLAFFDGLSHGEIAERLEQPLGTVKSRIRLGLNRLRTQLELPELKVER